MAMCLTSADYSFFKIPGHDKLHVTSLHLGVLRRVSELLFLSGCWLPFWKNKAVILYQFYWANCTFKVLHLFFLIAWNPDFFNTTTTWTQLKAYWKLSKTLHITLQVWTLKNHTQIKQCFWCNCNLLQQKLKWYYRIVST